MPAYSYDHHQIFRAGRQWMTRIPGWSDIAWHNIAGEFCRIMNRES